MISHLNPHQGDLRILVTPPSPQVGRDGTSRNKQWGSAECFSGRAMYCGFRISSLHSASLSHFPQPWNWICKPPAQHKALPSHFFVFCGTACSAHHLGGSSQWITGAYIPSFEIFSHTVTLGVVPPLGIFATALLLSLNNMGEVQKDTLGDCECGAF